LGFVVEGQRAASRNSVDFVNWLAKEKSRKNCGSLFYLNLERERERLLIVLVLVDLVAHVVGFAIQLSLILFGQVAVVLSHVFLFVVLQALLAFLQMSGLSGRELSVLHAVGDPILLVLFALIDLVDARMVGIIHARACTGGVGLCSGGPDKHQSTHREDYERLRDFGHANVNPHDAV
jgi:hypothetical protein